MVNAGQICKPAYYRNAVRLLQSTCKKLPVIVLIQTLAPRVELVVYFQSEQSV